MFLKLFPALPSPTTLEGGGSFVKLVSGASWRRPAVTLTNTAAPECLRQHVWVPTRYVAKHCNWRHDNLLRALKQFVRAKFKEERQLADRAPDEKTKQSWRERAHVYNTRSAKSHFMVLPRVDMEDMQAGGQGKVLHRGILAGDAGCYAVALPVWQEFVAWLMMHTIKFADRKKRLRSLGYQPLTEDEQWMAGTSGLDVSEHSSPLLQLVRSVYKDHLTEEDTRACTYVEAARSGEITFTGFAEDSTVGVTDLADFLGYKPRRLVEVLEQAGTSLSAEEMALRDDPNGKRIGYKAAMYLLLKLPKAQKQRLQLFNALFDKLQGPKLALEAGRPDFNNPVAARQAYLTLEHTYHVAVGEVETVRREKVEAESQLRVLTAAKDGLEARAAQLEKGLAQSAAAGNLAADNVDDHIVRNATALRREHNLMGKKDVLQDVQRFLHAQNQPELLLNQAEMFALMTWWTCEKLRDANGAPVIRQSIRQNDHARRYQVYVTGAGQEGAFQKHAAATKTSWMVFFTPKGVEAFRNSFTQLRQLWLTTGKPKACLDRSTQEAMLDVEVEAA